MSGSRGGRKGKSNQPMLSTSEYVERKSLFGRYSDAEMVAQLKGLAQDPCNLEISSDRILPLKNQTLRVRKVMALGDTASPWRKRTLEQFCKDTLKAPPGYASDASTLKNDTRISKRQLSHASSSSCLLNSAESVESFHQKILRESASSASLLTSEDIFQDRQIRFQSSFQDDAIDWRSSTKCLMPLVDSDESVNGSNPLTPENPIHQESHLLDLCDAIRATNSNNLNAQIQKNLHQPRQSVRVPNFIGYHIERKVIPVGPRFQVEVPEWTGPVGNGKYDGEDTGSEDSRWLGTRIWPVEGESTKTTAKATGKGRPDFCSCESHGSTDCIRRHILEERVLLQRDLGPAFFTWKFDEMGEQVAKSWTSKEQQTFETLVKMNTLSKRKDFVKHAMKSFPQRSAKAIVSYYFNVFVPRRISQRTRLSIEQVDSDEDEVDGFNYLNCGKRCKSSVISGSKNARKLYLRQPSY